MRIFSGLIVLAMIVGVVSYWNGGGSRSELSGGERAATLQSAAPVDFVLPDHAGKLVKLSDYRGRAVVVSFWASWCPPCLVEFPSLLKFAEKAKKEFGVETLAVSVDEKGWAAVDKLFKEKKLWPQGALPLTILLNTDAKVAASYGTDKYPETYFIDRNFRIIRKFVGVQDWMSQEMMKWIMENSK